MKYKCIITRRWSDSSCGGCDTIWTRTPFRFSIGDRLGVFFLRQKTRAGLAHLEYVKKYLTTLPFFERKIKGTKAAN